MNRFENKAVLLTGAASGMGRATAIRLSSEGARVFGVDRDKAGLDETAALIATAGSFVPRVADVSVEAEVIDAVRAAVAELGRIDVLANIAGVQQTTPLGSLTAEQMQRAFAINALGTVLFCRETAPHLPDGEGVIVNIASASASKGSPYMTAYAASKGAVLAATMTIAAELAPRRIRVLAISPGAVRTPLTAGVTFDDGAGGHLDASYYARVYPLFGYGEPEDIAATIAFAASQDGRFWAGSELRIDGGAYI
ncbi:MAG TPA: SDR family oxidoreductase [Jatrophihabitantaceae bacterium]|nr:SDR family oxidoreductase [Jatrophihabitantaceae bacterium]